MVGCVLLAGVVAGAAEDWSSVNTDRLDRFWSVVESNDRRVTVVAFGDSLQATYRSLPKPFFARLAALLGSAGRSFDGEYPPISIPVATNGVWRTAPTALWFLDHHVVPPGGQLHWRHSGFPNDSMPASRVGLYFVGWPQGGMFQVSLSTNGGPWTLLATVSGQRTEPTGCYTNWPVAPEGYRLRVDGVSGTNLVLAPELLDMQSPGIHTVWVQRDGHSLESILNRPPAVLDPILSNLHPDLVLWHMKETADFVFYFGEEAADLQFSNRMEQLEQWWQRAMPEGQVIYVGTPWAYSESSDYTHRQNRIVRDSAVRHGRVYFDGMTPMISYTSMWTNGFLVDSVHPSASCYDLLSDRLWDELGFFALRLDRRLKPVRDPGGIRLEWATRTNVFFEVQSSANLVDWQGVYSVWGDGSTQTWTNVTGVPGALFHRLRLSGE